MDALREELTIQQVILESLRGETFDGADAERAETHKEIERLTALLRQMRRAEPEQNGADGECRECLTPCTPLFLPMRRCGGTAQCLSLPSRSFLT